MPCHSERSEESLFFFGARFLTTFGMTKGAFGMTNTVICAHLRPFAKFAFGLLSFRAKRRISFRYFWLDPKVTKKSRLRALRTPSRHFQVGKSGNSLGSDSLIFYRPALCSVGSPPEAHGRTPKAFACSPNAALPHSPFEGGLLGGCSSAFGYRVYHA